MAYIPYQYVSHAMRVKRLYKAFLRDIPCWTTERHQIRINSVLLRAKFEENRNVKDPILAKKLLEEAEDKYHYIKHPEQIYFPDSRGGVAYQRKDGVWTPDHVLDSWHPLEKAQYPDYFARREQRKKEYVEWYDKTYGKPPFHQYE